VKESNIIGAVQEGINSILLLPDFFIKKASRMTSNPEIDPALKIGLISNPEKTQRYS
jgi:hypothetical protein